jgi:hypothetical protein
MFVTEESTLGLPLGWAAAQLGRIIESGWFRELSDSAYAAGLAVLAPAGPPGEVRELAKTMQVRLSGPRERMTGVSYALRWETDGPAGRLFPALDADLSLVQVDAGRTRLAIVACYRPQPGVRLDLPLLSRAAQTTVQSMVDGLAREIVQPLPPFAHTPVRSAPPAGEALCRGRASPSSWRRTVGCPVIHS